MQHTWKTTIERKRLPSKIEIEWIFSKKLTFLHAFFSDFAGNLQR